MLVNYSNHTSSKWGGEQLQAGLRFGEIVDIPFPNVEPSATKEDIEEMAQVELNKILEHKPDAVMCQGEFSLSYALTNMLLENGIKVLVACSARNVKETVEDGVTKKSIIFEFVQFRELSR